MSSKKIRGKNKFQDSWLSKEEYNLWLEKTSEFIARCKLCKRDISVANMGESAIRSHLSTAKHSKLVTELTEARKSLSVLHFLPKSSTSGACASSAKSISLQEIAIPLSVISAEIRWALNSVMSHFSMRSCLNMNTLLKAMFPDSEIAKRFQMSKTKIGYFITFGLAPYFRKALLANIRNSPYFSIMFDESLNKIFQEEQMDVQVRFWDNASNLAATRYLDSQFLHRPNAINLVKALDAALTELNVSLMIHLSMDGPNTN